MDEALWQRFKQRDRRALARLLSYAASGQDSASLLSRLPSTEHRSRVVALTGSGGVGKSTMIGQLLDAVLADKQSVAVLACDPQSPLSGGALLGDRFRMAKTAQHDEVFIRSLAALSGHSALADHLDVMIRILEVYGFDNIIIETVGAGQGDTAVRNLADVVVLLLQPETGDDLQWEKAGVLEVADVLTLNKFDLPNAEDALAQIKSAMQITGDASIPIIAVSAKNGEGIGELWDTISGRPLRRIPDAEGRDELLQLAQRALTDRFGKAVEHPTQLFREVLERWKNGELSSINAGCEVLDSLCNAND